MPTTSLTPISDAQLLERCRWRLTEVMPRPPETLAEARTALQNHRGQPIDIVIGDSVDGALPSGLWLQLRDRDVVWVDRRTSPMHRVVIIAHEFGHIICGHTPTPLDDDRPAAQSIRVLADRQMPGLSASNIAAILGHCRSAATREHREWIREREAEIVGRLLAERLLSERHARLAASLAEL